MQDENSGKDGRRFNEWLANRPDSRRIARQVAKEIEMNSEQREDNSTEPGCPYCTNDNKAVRETYFDQNCRGCVTRMTDTTQQACKSDKQERDALLPCPFCGAGETRFDHSNMWTGTRNQLVCVRIRHWCEKPMQTNFEVKGNTEAEAIAAWNRRATCSLQESPQGAEPVAEGCLPGCFYYTDSCFRKDCKHKK